MRDIQKKLKATFGWCENCERFFKHGEYMLKHDRILCNACMAKFDKELAEDKQRQKDIYG